VRLARGAAALVVVQFVLGGLSVTTRLAVPITVAHLAGGALLLATVVVLALWSRRLGSAQPAPAPALAAPLAPAISG
jgi:heme A synthase